MTMRAMASWTFYWTGDLVSRTIQPVFGHWFEWPYRLYGRLMRWSDELQGEGDGPWSGDTES